MMCTRWFTRTALCKRPSSANTAAVLSKAGGSKRPSPVPPSPRAAPTRAQEEDVVGAAQPLHAVHADLLVAQVALQQQRLAAHRAVHQEVVFDEVQHAVRHLQGRVDLQVPRVAGDALWRERRLAGATDSCAPRSRADRGCPVPFPHKHPGVRTVPGRGSGTGLVSVYHCWVSRFTSL